MPKKTEGYTQLKAHARQDRKRRDAYARQDKYDSLTVAEKIALVLKRGGSKKELERLTKANTPVARLAPKPVVAEAKEVAPAKPKRTRKSDVTKAAKAERPSKS